MMTASAILASSPALTAADFRKISELARARFGLNLPEGKEGLVAARLGKAIRQGGFASFGDYYRHVIADRSGEALIGLIDALTTNHTSFHREPAHFDFLAAAATGELGRARALRIWSSACSSGEEPYSIAMKLLDISACTSWKENFSIVASDISTHVLRLARNGIYGLARFQAVPEHWPRTYFRKQGGEYNIRPEVARLVQFERLNLIEPFPPRRFHFIFCRNVLMYFDKPTQQNIVQRMAVCLEPGGYLFIGHSETLNGIEHPLRYVRPAIYRSRA